METLEALSSRIDTTEDIQSIVRTMKSLSAVSIRQYEKAVEALQDYHRTVELGLQVVLHNQDLKAASQLADGRSAAIVIGSDRGLCGRFNEGLIDSIGTRLQKASHDGAPPLIVSVGGRAEALLQAEGWPVETSYSLPGSVNGLVKTAQSLLIDMDSRRQSGGISEIAIYYNRRAANTRALPTRQSLIPLSRSYLAELVSRPWPTRQLPAFTMAADDLLSWLIRQHLFISIYRAAAESLASEHASRLAAMQAAEKNIGERLGELSSEFRKKRQESITTELMDIISGFEAMQSDEADEDRFGEDGEGNV